MTNLPTTRDGWKGYLQDGQKKTVESIFEFSKRMLEYKEACGPGEGDSGSSFSADVKEWLGMSPPTATRWLGIAENRESVFRRRKSLPASYTTIYELSLLPPDDLDRGIREGAISPEATRLDVSSYKARLRDERAPKPEPKPKPKPEPKPEPKTKPGQKGEEFWEKVYEDVASGYKEDQQRQQQEKKDQEEKEKGPTIYDPKFKAMEAIDAEDMFGIFPLQEWAVKAIYKSLVQKNHPDKNSNTPESNAKLKEITLAYEYLTAKIRRGV